MENSWPGGHLCLFNPIPPWPLISFISFYEEHWDKHGLGCFGDQISQSVTGNKWSIDGSGPFGEELSLQGLLGLLCAPFTQRGNPAQAGEGFIPKAANDGLAGALTRYKPLTVMG